MATVDRRRLVQHYAIILAMQSRIDRAQALIQSSKVMLADADRRLRNARPSAQNAPGLHKN